MNTVKIVLFSCLTSPLVGLSQDANSVRSGTPSLSHPTYSLCQPNPSQIRADKRLIRGRVVDSHGQPVAHAYIYLEAPTHPDRDPEVFSVCTADFEGRFEVEQPTIAPFKDRWQLYTMEPYDQSSHLPLFPPFAEGLRLADSRLAGLTLPAGNQDLNIGNIGLELSLGTILIRVLDANSQPLLTERLLDKTRLPRLQFRLRDRSGEAIGLSLVHWEHIRWDTSTIEVKLPPGNWRLELCTEGKPESCVTIEPSFEISGKGTRVQADVKLERH